MRPMAPPLRFWKSRASTTCSRVTLPILVKMRPIGRPLSSLIAGGAAGAWAPPPLTPGVLPGAPGAAPGVPAGLAGADWPGARAGLGDRLAAGLFGRAAGLAGG